MLLFFCVHVLWVKCGLNTPTQALLCALII